MTELPRVQQGTQRDGQGRSPILAWTFGASVAGIVVFLALAAAGWPGFEPNHCRVELRPTCFCEKAGDGWIAQPANTWSNLGFVVVGLAIAAAADRGRLLRSPANPVTRTRFFPGVFAVVTALLGPGSMFLHGSLTRGGGTIDVASMYLFASLLLAYAAQRLFRLSRGAFAGIFGALAGTLILLQATVRLPVELTFGLLLAGFALGELSVSRVRRELRIDRRFLLLAAGLFGAAFALWVPSLSGGPLCNPESLLQGHAAWHVLCALAAGSLFLYFASEREARSA
jgi:drug/metabolite transporter (DMT)-like permease